MVHHQHFVVAALETRRAFGDSKPLPVLCHFFPLCSAGGSTNVMPIFTIVPYLTVVMSPSIVSWIQMLIWITTKI